jgi:hypothetical protein
MIMKTYNAYLNSMHLNRKTDALFIGCLTVSSKRRWRDGIFSHPSDLRFTRQFARADQLAPDPDARA